VGVPAENAFPLIDNGLEELMPKVDVMTDAVDGAVALMLSAPSA
jgi:hypothetical protein